MGTVVLVMSGLITACQPGDPPSDPPGAEPIDRPGATSSQTPVPPPSAPSPPGSLSPAPADTEYTLTTNSADGQRESVTLRCQPSVQGSHPNAEAACAQLTVAGGDPARITELEGKPCTREFLPVTAVVTAEGRQIYSREFSNPCLMHVATRNLFDF